MRGATNSLYERLNRGDSVVELWGWIGPDGSSQAGHSIQRVGGFEDIERALRLYAPEHVIMEITATSTTKKILDCLGGSEANVWLLNEFFPLGANTTAAAEPRLSHRLSHGQRIPKRIIDLLIALPLTLAALPLLVLLALIVKLDSPGPAVFKQPRVGEGGRLFGMYKLRTMRADTLDPGGREPKRPEDSRVTRVGRWLRHTSLDELPQLVNVLKGDLSLVGPRPEVLANLDHYSGAALDRFAVPQGMTGLWQIKGRQQPMYEYFDQDLEYVSNWSLMLDAKILLLTPTAVLRGEGAF